MDDESGKFKVSQVTKLEDLADKTVKEIPESDLTIQTDTHIIQLEYNEKERQRKQFIIKSGCFSMTDTSMGVILEKFELREYNLLKTIDNTSMILRERDRFFSKLDVYKELERDPKRAILLCSPPGVGKTATINDVIKSSLTDKSTAAVIWDTSEIRASSVNKFFLSRSTFHKDVKRLILIIEDIEGGTSEDDYSSKGINSSLLNFLDGVGNPFKGIPTFIIATTNNPERSVGALIDRPGRFDKVIEMKTPDARECYELLKFIRKSDKAEDELEAAAKMAADSEFSIAHLQEAVVRSMLDDITVKEAVEQLVGHKKRFKEAFSKKPKGRLGLG
jgi:SpoVK/Ycf46/Vps4 family AAA+-type ATPase